jgi:ribosomal protein S18 acetylase RimI-like enzyme
MDIKITNARPSDARQIQSVLNKTWLATYPNKKIGVTVADIRYRQKGSLGSARLQKRREDIRNSAHSKKYWLVAKMGKKVVGVCGVAKEKDKNKLGTIYVLPKYQGTKIGYRLWIESRKLLNPRKRTIVHTATYNKKAVAFYRKLGFKNIGKRFMEERLRMKSGVIIPQIEMVLEPVRAGKRS